MKAWRSPAALSGAAVVALAVLVAVLAPFLTTADPIAQHLDLLLAPPSANHLLGTDELGRDTYSRLLFGARTSLGVGLSATAIALCGGLLVGLVAGWSGGPQAGTASSPGDARSICAGRRSRKRARTRYWPCQQSISSEKQASTRRSRGR